jgi:hypothetical protein
MKIVKVLFSISFPIVLSITCPAQSWLWGRQIQAPGGTLVCAFPVASTSSGGNNNAYVTGSFLSYLYFSTDTLSGTQENLYVAKYNSAGALKWAVNAIDSNNQSSSSNGYTVSSDNNGNVYVSGSFIGTMQIGRFTLRCTPDLSGGNGDVFLVKFDSSGNIIWAKQGITPSRFDFSCGLWTTVDNAGNIILAGVFTDTLSFGTLTLMNPSNVLNNLFIIKLDPNGNILWGQQSKYPHPNNGSLSGDGQITTDNNNNIFLTGAFGDTISFGTYTLSNLGNPNNLNAFLVKYSSSGNVLWAKQSTDNGTGSVREYGNGVTTDVSGNSYLTGYFENSAKFGNYTLTGSNYTLYLVKYDPNGNILWAKCSSKNSYWIGTSMASDSHNHIYIGAMSVWSNPDSLIFGNLTIHCPRPNTGSSSAGLVMMLDTAGNPLCGSILPNINKYPRISADISGNYIYMGGLFTEDTVFCGPNILIDANLNNGGMSIFLGRWQSCANTETGINSITPQPKNIRVYPNPSTGQVSFQIVGVSYKFSVKIYNVLGEEVYSQYNIPNSTFTVNLFSLPNGVYLYRVLNEEGSPIGEGKVVIQK